MFVIKYDKVSMINLVRAIEKYPAIYNTKKHFSKESQDVAWDKVAIEVGEKDSLCRDRWHSIKSCYIRHLKYTALNSTRRPYYLAEYLDFLLPFVSDRVQKFITLKQYELTNLPSYLKDALPATQAESSLFNQRSANGQQPEIKTEIIDIEEECMSEWLGRSTDKQQPSSSKSSKKRSTPDNSISPPKKPKKVNINNSGNEDINFFKSLMPEIARMSSHQKLKFKQEALSIIEDILYATDDVNVTD